MTKYPSVLHGRIVNTVLLGVEKLLTFKGEPPVFAESNSHVADEVEHLNYLLSVQEESHRLELEKSRNEYREIECDFGMVYELVYERMECTQ